MLCHYHLESYLLDHTKLDDRTDDQVALEEVERIGI